MRTGRRGWSVGTALGLCLVAGAHAQGIKISPPLDVEREARVDDVRTSPDGRWVVYQASTVAFQGGGVFSVPVDGGDVNLVQERSGVEIVGVTDEWVVLRDSENVWRRAVNGDRAGAAGFVPFDATIGRVRLTPDGSRIVYTARMLGSGWELFAVPVEGGAEPLRLGGSLRNDVDFLLSEDGARAVWLADPDVPGTYDLFGAPLDGSAPAVKLSGAGALHGSIALTRILLTKDGTHVTYRARDALGLFHLFAAPTDGSAPPNRLDPPVPEIRGVLDHLVTPDGTCVYTGNLRRELFSVPATGGEPIQISEDGANDVSVGPDGRYAIFRWLAQWYVTAVDGSGEPRLAPIPSDSSPVFSPDGARLLYQRSGAEGPGIWSVGVLRGEAVELTGSGGIGVGQGFLTTSAGEVVYRQNHEYRSVPVRGGTPRVLGSFPSLSRVRSSTLAADESHLLVVLDLYGDGWDVYELFSIDLDAARPPAPLNPPLATEAPHGSIHRFAVTPDGRTAVMAVYTDGDPGGDEVLFGASLGAEPRWYELYDGHRTLVRAQQICARAGRLVFLEEDSDDETRNVLSVPLDASAPAVRLDDPARYYDYADGVGQFVVSPDEQWVVFDIDLDDAPAQLLAVPSAGGAEVPLSGDLPLGGDVLAIRVTPDSQQVVYVAEQEQNGRFDLLSVPIVGGVAPVRLSDVPVAGGNVQADLVLTPDGKAVVYRADTLADETFELFAVPVEGGVLPTRLSAPLAAGGDVQADVRLTPDGAHVIYVADGDTDEVFELYVADVDGAAPAARLPIPLVVGGDVQRGFELAAGGTQVVYRADALEDERYELFAIPVDGSAPPRRLNGPLVAGGDVRSNSTHFNQPFPAFRVSPDGQRVVYLSDSLVDERLELHAVPIDGSAQVVLLSGFVVEGGGVVDGFEITPDSTRVVFCGDLDEDEVFELFVSPIDRVKARRRVSAPLVEGGDTAVPQFSFPSFAVSANSKVVLYRADQERDGFVELFLSFLDRPLHRGGTTPAIR
jgi:Tol biopolymer transport system component